MFRKYLLIFVTFFSLLLNVQAGFSHDVEHINHGSHESSAECEDCFLKHHLVKSIDLSKPFGFDFPNSTNLVKTYRDNNSIVYTFVAYQSQAP
jgi:hypothetical protein